MPGVASRIAQGCIAGDKIVVDSVEASQGLRDLLDALKVPPRSTVAIILSKTWEKRLDGHFSRL